MMYSRTKYRWRAGFSLVELLVIISIIALLIGLSMPVFLAVKRGAKAAAAEIALKTLATGIEQFRNDFGYLPPLILDDPAVDPTSQDWCTSLMSRSDAAIKLREERYHSMYSLSVYLLGVGELNPDPALTDPDRHDGLAGPGLRDPGSDRAWGGARVRTVLTHRVAIAGQTYGPYVSTADSERVRRASPLEFDFPEDTLPSVTDIGPWQLMSVLVDDWGTPIRYYRNWPKRVVGQTNPSFLDVPAEIISVDALRDAPSGSSEFDASRDEELARGEYVLLSAGPDRLFSAEGFAKQGVDRKGSVFDFLMNAADRARLIREGFADNIRLVK